MNYACYECARKDLGILTSADNQKDLEKRIRENSDSQFLLGICSGSGSILPLKGDSTMIFRLRGDRCDSEFYPKYVLPLAKKFLYKTAKIYLDEKKRMNSNEIYSVPVIQLTQAPVINTLTNELGFPVGDRFYHSFPKISLVASQKEQQMFLKGLIATSGWLKLEKNRGYRRLQFRERPKNFLNNVEYLFGKAYGMPIKVNHTSATLSPSNTKKLFELGAIIHPHQRERYLTI